jgi:hypothetical protein
MIKLTRNRIVRPKLRGIYTRRHGRKCIEQKEKETNLPAACLSGRQGRQVCTSLRQFAPVLTICTDN